jgi:sporulation integral membrane protein YtvI
MLSKWKRWFWPAVITAAAFMVVPYSIPLILAFLTAILLEGAVKGLIARLRFNRLQAVLAVFIGYVSVLAFLIFNLISIIAKQAVSLSQRTPTFVRDFYSSVIQPLIGKWEFYSKGLPSEVALSIHNTIERAVNSLDMFLQTVVAGLMNFLTAVPGFIFEILFYLIGLFLFSLELPRLKQKFESFLKDETKQKVFMISGQLTHAGVGFIKAQIIFSFITFVMAFAGLAILKAPYPGLLSLLIVIVDILPILGTGSVLVPWAIVVLLQGNLFLGIGLIVLFLVITVVRRAIEPKIYSTSLGITPLASFVSMYIGLKMLGIVGLFAGPIVVIIYETLKKANVIQIKFKI